MYYSGQNITYILLIYEYPVKDNIVIGTDGVFY